MLMERFWPGPLTILFPKSDLVPDLVTAGLEQVAIRMPRHPVFVEVLRAFGKPLAAPSANRFGRISPTRGEHVFEELAGRIPLILDAGPTIVGLESTIVRVSEEKIEILRQGAVSEENLAEIAPTKEFAVTGNHRGARANGKPLCAGETAPSVWTGCLWPEFTPGCSDLLGTSSICWRIFPSFDP